MKSRIKKINRLAIISAIILSVCFLMNNKIYAKEVSSSKSIESSNLNESNIDKIKKIIDDHNNKYLELSNGIVRGYNKVSKNDELIDINKYFNLSKLQLTFPVNKKYYGITSNFGVRRDPFNFKSSKEITSLPFHRGLDIAAAGINGAEVYSVLDGKVDKISRMESTYGNLVIIDHGGLKTYYAHLSSIANIKEGDKISAGDVLGKVGSTGRSTGPHLHIEFVVGNVLINPRVFLEGANVVESISIGNSKVNNIDDTQYNVLEIEDINNLDEGLDQINIDNIDDLDEFTMLETEEIIVENIFEEKTGTEKIEYEAMQTNLQLLKNEDKTFKSENNFERPRYIEERPTRGYTLLRLENN